MRPINSTASMAMKGVECSFILSAKMKVKRCMQMITAGTISYGNAPTIRFGPSNEVPLPMPIYQSRAETEWNMRPGDCILNRAGLRSIRVNARARILVSQVMSQICMAYRVTHDWLDAFYRSCEPRYASGVIFSSLCTLMANPLVYFNLHFTTSFKNSY